MASMNCLDERNRLAMQLENAIEAAAWTEARCAERFDVLQAELLAERAAHAKTRRELTTIKPPVTSIYSPMPRASVVQIVCEHDSFGSL